MSLDSAFPSLELKLLDGRFAVSRLDCRSGLPSWAFSDEGFTSITRTPDELSIVSAEASVPEGVRTERGWRALRVVGTQDFALVGVLASLVGPLALAKISVFAVATFDTDYLLIKDLDLDLAVQVLRSAGHSL